MEILAHLCKPWQDVKAPECPTCCPQMVHLRDFFRLADKRFRDRLPLPGYCKALLVSESKLKRICKQKLAISPCQCIEWRRLMEAVKFLLTDHIPIHQVARRSGFEDAAYFSRIFKAHTGFSPRRLRQRFGRVKKLTE